MANNPLLKACPNELKLANIYPKYKSDIFKPARLLFVFNAANNASTYMYIHIKLLESQISVEQFWYITYSFCCLSYLKKYTYFYRYGKAIKMYFHFSTAVLIYRTNGPSSKFISFLPYKNRRVPSIR